MEEALRKRLKRTTLEFTAGFGFPTWGNLTDEGIDRLLDALKLEDLEIKQKGQGQ